MIYTDDLRVRKGGDLKNLVTSGDCDVCFSAVEP